MEAQGSPHHFTLVNDDFGVKYTNRDDADHLMNTLKKLYTVSVDWTADKYRGIQLDWDYAKRTYDLPMPAYVDRSLYRFQFHKLIRPHTPSHALSLLHTLLRRLSTHL